MSDYFLFAEAMVRLGMARLMVAVLPFRFLAKRLGEHERETTHEDDPASQATIRRVRWAILAACRRAPWRCKCLEQSIAAKRMLRARGVATTLYLGVARPGAIEAHAWLRCGSVFVCGGDGASRFAVVSCFGR
jgi:transglutaminase superfamily protein